jgi:hypothetical protein
VLFAIQRRIFRPLGKQIVPAIDCDLSKFTALGQLDLSAIDFDVPPAVAVAKPGMSKTPHTSTLQSKAKLAADWQGPTDAPLLGEAELG